MESFLPRTIRPLRLTFPILLLFVFSTARLAQSGKCRSVSVDRSAGCANMVVEYRGITARRLVGKVDWPGDSRVVIEVFKVNRIKEDEGLWSATDRLSPIIVLETNERGEFCHSGLEDGLYVIKFGTDEGGWNCSWIKVRIARTGAERKVEIGLEIGT